MARGFEQNNARAEALSVFGKTLARRSKSVCELCSAATSLHIYEVPPVDTPDVDKCLLICDTCQAQLHQPEQLEPNHWRGLNETIWSETAAIQVVSWRMLQHLQSEGWAQDLLDQVYLDDAVLAWAQQGAASGAVGVKTFDSNGVELLEGDDVHLIKDLDVKGTSFTAKRGTLVKGIHLTDSPEYVEGRVNKVQIVLKTAFLKKAS